MTHKLSLRDRVANLTEPQKAFMLWLAEQPWINMPAVRDMSVDKRQAFKQLSKLGLATPARAVSALSAPC